MRAVTSGGETSYYESHGESACLRSRFEPSERMSLSVRLLGSLPVSYRRSTFFDRILGVNLRLAISHASQLIVGKRHALCAEDLIGINIQQLHAAAVPNLQDFTKYLDFECDQNLSIRPRLKL